MNEWMNERKKEWMYVLGCLGKCGESQSLLQLTGWIALEWLLGWWTWLYEEWPAFKRWHCTWRSFAKSTLAARDPLRPRGSVASPDFPQFFCPAVNPRAFTDLHLVWAFGRAKLEFEYHFKNHLNPVRSFLSLFVVEWKTLSFSVYSIEIKN